MDKNFNTKLGLRIRELRVIKGLKQGKLADLLDMERSNFTRIEGGKQHPKYSNLIKLAQILGVNIKDIFDFEDTIKNEKQLKEEIIQKLENLSLEELKYINRNIDEIKLLRHKT